MGQVPPLVLLLSGSLLAGCEPAPNTEPVQAPVEERADPALRDAGVAAREALEKAGEALKKLGEAATGKAEETLPEPPEMTQPDAPVEERTLVPIDLAGDGPIDEVRDSGAATAEAAARFLDATRKAAAKVKEAGKGVVEAMREDAPADAPADAADNVVK
ncbi:MAG: hypothetical protein FHP92_15595 [Denitromonas halophila]|nr:MAG: hypothetical protein FHP92_15595 [Denitromonas halophila]